MLSLRRFAVSVYKYILLYILRFFKFYLNDMPIKTSNVQGADRIIWVKERQNPLTVDHLT